MYGHARSAGPFKRHDICRGAVLDRRASREDGRGPVKGYGRGLIDKLQRAAGAWPPG